MRNLKKLLALTLAMVMAFSMMLTANAAVKFDDYTDKDNITAEFVEGVQVLTGLQVMQGDEKGFRPSDKITRAEAAAVIYRAVTGDVTDRQTDLYKDYSTFTDVKSDDWFAGYVGYCQNAGYIKGTSPTTFNPYGQVTGYEVLAMILRAVGYGKNNEFTGSAWQVNVAALSKQLGVTRDVTAAHMEQTLNMAAPREVVADLVFMTIATVPTVTFTPALAYNDKQNVLGGEYNATLGQQTFGLWYQTSWMQKGDWARPGYSWYKNGSDNGGTTNSLTGKAYVVKDNHPTYSGPTAGNLVATIMAVPDYETKVQVHECDVAAALEIDTEDTFELYVNGANANYTTNGAVSNDYRIVATDTVTKVGGQGRVSEFYYELERASKWFDETTDLNVAVMIDTMLAQVTAKTDAKLDPANHVITPAQLEVTIWDGGIAGANPVTTGAYATQQTASKRIISKASDDKANWDEYARGDYILLNAYTNKDARGGNSTTEDSAAFQTDEVVGNDTTNMVMTIDRNVFIVDNGKDGKPDSIQGKQTVTYWNQDKHQVDGKDYDDQLCLFMDKAGSVTNTTFTWFFDQYGNLIGIGDAHNTNFGVITSVYAAFGQGESDTTGAVKAVATVKFSNGETGTVTIDRFLIPFGNTIPDDATGTTAGGSYALTAGTAITTVNTSDQRPVYDNVSHAAMSSSRADPSFTPSNADVDAWIYMAPSTSTNNNAHFADDWNQQDPFGILYNNLFQFSVANDNAVVATMVAGDWNANNNGNGAGQTNTAFNGLANEAANGTNDKLFKNLGYMMVDSKYVYLTNDTQIMVKMGDNSAARTINTYTLSDLPGDVTIPDTTEVDWADTDGDGRADVVYIANGSMPSTITYGLFYYNGGAAQWDAGTSTGTIAGYLNGKAETISTKSRAAFNVIQGSNGYDAHLFAVQFTNGDLSAVMYSKNATWVTPNYKQFILADEANAALTNPTNTVLAFDADGATTTSTVDNITTANTDAAWATATQFGIGTAYGNSYTATTQAVYYRDSNDATGGNSAVSWVRVSNGNQIVVTGTGAKTYWLSPNCDIVGELAWLNSGMTCYVTMVYDTAAADAVTQLYISHDPDVTPVPGPGVAGVANRPVGTIVRDGGSTLAGLVNALKAGAANTVVYTGSIPVGNDTSTAIYSALGIDNSSNPVNENMFFPYSVAGSGVGVTFEILDGANNVVYSENASVSTGGAFGGDVHVFAVNFKGNTPNAGSPAALILTEGVTYSFRITTATATGVVTLSQGTFTMR